MKGTVICDGRGNAGTGAIAAVLDREDGLHVTAAKKIEATTNIVAEHLSIQLGMKLAKEHGITELAILNDSQTPVYHVLGTYKVKQDHLKPLVEETWEMARGFASVGINWVPREQTSEADKLCREVDRPPAGRSRPQLSSSKPQLRNPFARS